MAYTLDTIPGNLRTAALSLEAFRFNEQSGTYKSLVTPSRALTVITGGVALSRNGVGKRGFCPQFNNGGGNYLSATTDDSWNCLSANENYFAIAFWYMKTGSGSHGIGLAGSGAAETQCIIETLESSIAAAIYASDDATTCSVDTGVAVTSNTWNFVCAQFYYNGASGGSESVTIKVRVNSTDYTTMAGTQVVVPNPTPVSFRVGDSYGTVAQNARFDGLILWKGTTWLNDTSLDALYNGGLGMSLRRSSRRRRMIRRASV